MAQPRNGDNVWLLGAERSGNEKFNFLSGFWSEFGEQAKVVLFYFGLNELVKGWGKPFHFFYEFAFGIK